MHLYLREFACVHTHKCKRSFLRAFSCTGLIKRKARLRAKNRKTQTHFGFRNFQDVLYIHTNTSSSLYVLMHIKCTFAATSVTAVSVEIHSSSLESPLSSCSCPSTMEGPLVCSPRIAPPSHHTLRNCHWSQGLWPAQGCPHAPYAQFLRQKRKMRGI